MLTPEVLGEYVDDNRHQATNHGHGSLSLRIDVLIFFLLTDDWVTIGVLTLNTI